MSSKYIRSRLVGVRGDDEDDSSFDSSSIAAAATTSVITNPGGRGSATAAAATAGGDGTSQSSATNATSHGSTLASMLRGTRMKFTDGDTSSVASNLTEDDYYTIQPPVGPPSSSTALSAVPETSITDEIDREYIVGRQTPAQVDDLLRLEHLQLTNEEQQDREDEVHGYLSRSIQETPELLSESLHQMQQCVQNLPTKFRTTYDRITTTASTTTTANNNNNNNNYSYVLHNQEFWLKFLRADLFDVQKAAIRYCKHLDILHKYFGETSLTRPLYLSDLNKQDQRLLKQGRFQVLMGTRDRSGRRVFTMCEPMGKGFDVSCRIKVMLYVFSVASDDILTQRDGGVALLLSWTQDAADLFMVDSKNQSATVEMIGALPLRFSGVHLCLEDQPMAHVVKSVQLMTAGKDIRQNTRVHIGSQLETLYELQQRYGVPINQVPLTSTGTIKVLQWKLWIRTRHSMDESRQTRENRGEYFSNATTFFRGVECPDFQCILFRKAGMAWDHPPNKVFRSLLESKQIEKASAKKLNAKIQIVTDILQEAQSLGFRFMTWDDNNKAGNGGPWYVEITDMFYLRECVAQAMRDSIKRERIRRNVQVQESKGKEGIFAGQDGKKRKMFHTGENTDTACGGCFCSM